MEECVKFYVRLCKFLWKSVQSCTAECVKFYGKVCKVLMENVWKRVLSFTKECERFYGRVCKVWKRMQRFRGKCVR